MQYLTIIIFTIVLFATDNNLDISEKLKNQEISSNDIAYNYQYQQNRTSYNAYSNQSAYHLDRAGQHLRNFRSQYYTGHALILGGIILGISAADSEDEGPRIIGTGVTLIGMVMSLLSNIEIGKAGEELQQASRAMQ